MLFGSCQIGTRFLNSSWVVGKFAQKNFVTNLCYVVLQQPRTLRSFSTNITNFPRAKMAKFLYPEARSDDTKDVYHGVEVRILFEPYVFI